MGDRFDSAAFVAHGYEILAPGFLGPAFSKRAGTGIAVSFRGAENIELGMDDFEFVRPVKHEKQPQSTATAEKGRHLLDALAADLSAFVSEIKKVSVEVRDREFADRTR